MTEQIQYSAQGPVRVITFCRPRVFNALTVEMLEELERILDALQQDAACRVVILTGAGRGFMAGADISCMKEATAQEAMAFSRATQRVFRKLEMARPFTIAAVNGYALGGGLELAMACDVRLAVESARLGLPETAIGSFPGSGGTRRLVRLCGVGRAKEFLATAEKLSAAQALSWGIVEHVVPDAQLMDRCMELAQKVCRNSGEAVTQGKRLMTLSLDMTEEESAQLVTAQIGQNYGSHDQREGMRAFLEKRAPHFR